jgi:hypothetical protein
VGGEFTQKKECIHLKIYRFMADIISHIWMPVTVTAASLEEAKEKALEELDRATYGTAKLGELIYIED